VVGERGKCAGGYTGTFRLKVCENLLSLGGTSRPRGTAGYKLTGLFSSRREERDRHREVEVTRKKDGDLPVPSSEGKRNEAGRAMSSRRTYGPRTAIVL
jgi:hypothetical protein